jgi:hypothetical protein
MNSINASFVSYRHTDDPDSHAFVKAFVRQLRKQLKWFMPNAPIYFDEEGLKVGDQYSGELAYQLCRSASMVLFFSPLHFDVQHPYCAIEYQAMLRLETQRLGVAAMDLRNKGLIFPVVFRGLNYLPPEIINSRNYENFDSVVVETDFERRDCQKRLMGLAEQIFLRYKSLINAGAFELSDCTQFTFPDKLTIRDWLDQVTQIQWPRMPGH